MFAYYITIILQGSYRKKNRIKIGLRINALQEKKTDNTLYDKFGPFVSLLYRVLPINKEKTFIENPMNIPKKFGPVVSENKIKIKQHSF